MCLEYASTERSSLPSASVSSIVPKSVSRIMTGSDGDGTSVRDVRRAMRPDDAAPDKKNCDGSARERRRNRPNLQCDCTVIRATGRGSCLQQGTCWRSFASGGRGMCARLGGPAVTPDVRRRRERKREGDGTAMQIPSSFEHAWRGAERASGFGRGFTRVVAWALLASTSLACATAGPRGPESPVNAGAILLISNNTPDDQPIYLRRESSEIPIGVVTSFTSRTFVVPGAYLGAGSDYSLIARRRGVDDAMRSDLFRIPPGATVRWIVDRSHATVAEVRR